MELGFAIALVIGLTQVVKKMRFIADRYIPFVALILGVAVVTMLEASVTGITIASGIVVGLSSMGMWSGSKTILK